MAGYWPSFFFVCDIADEEENTVNRQAILLRSKGSNCFQVLKYLAFPNRPNMKTFDQLATLLH